MNKVDLLIQEKRKKREEKIQQVVQILELNSRARLTTISRITGIPVSTVYDFIKQVRQVYNFTIISKSQNASPGKAKEGFPEAVLGVIKNDN